MSDEQRRRRGPISIHSIGANPEPEFWPRLAARHFSALADGG